MGRWTQAWQEQAPIISRYYSQNYHVNGVLVITEYLTQLLTGQWPSVQHKTHTNKYSYAKIRYKIVSVA